MKRISPRSLVLVTWMLAVALLSGDFCHGDGVIRDGLGARASGRGGTNIGFADNVEMLLDNPAAMTNISGKGLAGLSMDMLITDLRYADPDNSRTSASNDPFPVGDIGVIRKIGDGRLAIGLGMYSQAGFSSKYHMEGPPPLPGQQMYKAIGTMARVLPGAAFQVNDRLSVGGTLGVAVGHTELEGPYYLQGPNPFRGTPTKLDVQGTGAALSWSLGMQYQLTPKTMLGLTYLGETSFHLDGSTRVEVPGLGSSYFDSTLDKVWPRSLGIGIAHSPCRHKTFSADVIWYDWSSSFSQFDLHMTDPRNPAFLALTGPSLTDSLPLDWRDSISIRLGFERKLSCCRTLRTGYVYHRNPIPDQTLTPFIQATLEHAVSVGYGWMAGGVAIDLAYQFSFGPTRHVGTSALAGGDFSGSDVTTYAHWLMIGFQRAR